MTSGFPAFADGDIGIELGDRILLLHRKKLMNASGYLKDLLKGRRGTDALLQISHSEEEWRLILVSEADVPPANAHPSTITLLQTKCHQTEQLLRLFYDLSPSYPTSASSHAALLADLSRLATEYACIPSIPRALVTDLLKANLADRRFITHHPAHALLVAYHARDATLFRETVALTAGRFLCHPAHRSSLPDALERAVARLAAGMQSTILERLGRLTDCLSPAATSENGGTTLSAFVAEALVRRYVDVRVGRPTAVTPSLYKELRHMHDSKDGKLYWSGGGGGSGAGDGTEAVTRKLDAVHRGVRAAQAIVQGPRGGGLAREQPDEVAAVKAARGVEAVPEVVLTCLARYQRRIKEALAPLFPRRRERDTGDFDFGEFQGRLPWEEALVGAGHNGRTNGQC